MKKFLALAVCMMIPAMVCAPASAMVDRFDEVTTEPDAAIGNGYAGFNWQEFWVLNAPNIPGIRRATSTAWSRETTSRSTAGALRPNSPAADSTSKACT